VVRKNGREEIEELKRNKSSLAGCFYFFLILLLKAKIFFMKNLNILLLSLLVLLMGWTLPSNAQEYYVYVTAESEDEVALIKFDGQKATVEERIVVGTKPAEIEGPHGITVAPDGKYWYLSMAHGTPYGQLVKYSTEDNEPVATTELGIFPASMQISKANGLLYVVNFNLHGRMIPSSVSVVDPELMFEIKKITTGAMPHGSRISPDGLRQYSVAMMSGELFEINTMDLDVSRTLDLEPPGTRPKEDKSKKEAKVDHSQMDHSQMDHSQMGHDEMMYHSIVKPTWVIPHPSLPRAYVAGNGSNELIEIDTKKWKVTHRMSCGKGPYNVEISPDGKLLVVTYKSEGATGIWDIATREELAKVANSRKVSHGVAISPDSKYAFISVEGKNGEPGSVDVIDLSTFKRVAVAEVGKQAGGIAFWKIEE
jgi:DNA-binding beta-propeller fold protein YncE